MLRNKKAILMVATLLLVASQASAQFARRLPGIVVDENDQPIVGAKVVATSPDLGTFKNETTTDEDGKFKVLVLAANIKRLHLLISAEGYGSLEDEFGLPFSARLPTVDFKLISKATVARIEQAKFGIEANRLHEEGVSAAQAGDWAAAAESFSAALEVDETLPASHANLATAAYNLEDYPRAETHARRALELGSELPDLDSLLAEALARQGKTAEAAALDPELRANLAYNRGADEFNAGDSDKAYASFIEACDADPTLTDAHYQAGRVAFSLGKLEQARKHLEHYIEIDPDGTNIATAKQLVAAIP